MITIFLLYLENSNLSFKSNSHVTSSGKPSSILTDKAGPLTYIMALPHYSVLVHSGLSLPTNLSSSKAGIKSDWLLYPRPQVQGLAQGGWQ